MIAANQTFAFGSVVHALSRHFAVAQTKGAVGSQIARQAPGSIICRNAAVARQKTFFRMMVQLPFDDCAGQVPRNVGWARIKMVVAVGATIYLQPHSTI